jgi:hypothetical protein
MEPLNEEELHALLQKWQEPGAPPSLQAKVLGPPRAEPWWKWLIAGSIRVPAPVGVLTVLLVIGLALFGVRAKQPPPAGEVNLADFQPVKELKPRIIRSAYESN